MARPLPPPTPTDESRAAEFDELLVRSRVALARVITRWLSDLGISHRQTTALSTVASGRCRLPPTTMTRIRQVASDPRLTWYPQPQTLMGLADVNALIAGIEAGEVQPPHAVRDIVHRLKPLRRADGELMTAEDMARVLVGAEGILEPVETAIDDPRLETLAPVLGLVIERVIIATGRSPLREASAFLGHYPLPEERPLLRQVLEGEVIPAPAQLAEMLPGIAYALSRLTGESWDCDRIHTAALDLAVGPSMS